MLSIFLDHSLRIKVEELNVKKSVRTWYNKVLEIDIMKSAGA